MQVGLGALLRLKSSFMTGKFVHKVSLRHKKSTWLHILVTQYTDTEYKFCLLFLAGHEFGDECSWLAADEEVGQYI